MSIALASPRAKTRSYPSTCSVGRVRMNPSAPAGRREVAGQVAGHRPDAVAAIPEVGLDPPPGLRGHRERPRLARVGRRLALQPVAQHELDAALVELAPQLGPELGLVRPGDDVRRDVDDGDPLVRPRARDLAGQLQADGAGADQQHARGTRQRLVRLLVAGVRVAQLGGVRLRRERIRRAARQDEDVGTQLLARPQDDAPRLGVDDPVAHEAAVLQQAVERVERARQPGRIDEDAEGRDVVGERLLRVDEDDVGVGVETLGDVDAGVAAADHDDGGTGGQRLDGLGHAELPSGRGGSLPGGAPAPDGVVRAAL